MLKKLKLYWLPAAVILVVVFATYLTFKPENSQTSNAVVNPANLEASQSSRMNYNKVRSMGYSDIEIYLYLKENQNVRLYNQPAIWPPQPTEKALKVASFLVVRFAEDGKGSLKKSYGSEEMSDSELTYKMAFTFDADPAKMAYAEADMRRITTNENRPVINNPPDTASNSDLNDQVEKLKRENDELDNYKRDFEFNCIISGGVPTGTMCL